MGNAQQQNAIELLQVAALRGDYEMWHGAARRAQAEARQEGDRCADDISAALRAWHDAGQLTLMLTRLIADGQLPAVIGEALMRVAEQDTGRRNARHTGAPPTEQEKVARALLAAFADPASGLTFAAVKAGQEKSDVYIWALKKNQGVETNRHTLKRAIEALDAGKFGGVPP